LGFPNTKSLEGQIDLPRSEPSVSSSSLNAPLLACTSSSLVITECNPDTPLTKSEEEAQISQALALSKLSANKHTEWLKKIHAWQIEGSDLTNVEIFSMFPKHEYLPKNTKRNFFNHDGDCLYNALISANHDEYGSKEGIFDIRTDITNFFVENSDVSYNGVTWKEAIEAEEETPDFTAYILVMPGSTMYGGETTLPANSKMTGNQIILYERDDLGYKLLRVIGSENIDGKKVFLAFDKIEAHYDRLYPDEPTPEVSSSGDVFNVDENMQLCAQQNFPLIPSNIHVSPNFGKFPFLCSCYILYILHMFMIIYHIHMSL
jgi:hypothetical protein